MYSKVTSGNFYCQFCFWPRKVMYLSQIRSQWRLAARIGGRGVNQNCFIRGGSAPRYDRGAGLTPYPFIYHFWRYPFRIPSSHKIMVLLSHTWLRTFNCCKCSVFKTMSFSWHSHSHKMNQLALLGLFTDQNDRFLYPLIYFNKWNPYPFIYLNPEISTPFGRSPPPRMTRVQNVCACARSLFSIIKICKLFPI